MPSIFMSFNQNYLNFGPKLWNEMILMSTVEQSRSMGTIENPEARGTKRMPYTL